MAQGIYESNVVVTTFAGGNGTGILDGPGNSAQFNRPSALALDGRADLVVVDYEVGAIRRVSIDANVTRTVYKPESFEYVVSAIVTNSEIFIGGKERCYKVSASGFVPLSWDVRFPAGGSKFLGFLQIASWGQNGFLVGSPVVKEIFQIIGDDVVVLAGSFDLIRAIAVGPGGVIYVLDRHRVKALLPDARVVNIAGGASAGYFDGPSDRALFRDPTSIAVDGLGNVYVSDTGNNVVRMVKVDGSVRTLAGRVRGYKNGAGTDARFSEPSGIAALDFGTLFVCDSLNHSIRKIAFTPTQQSTTSIQGRMFFGVQLNGGYGRMFRIETAANPQGPWLTRSTEIITSLSGSQLWIDTSPQSSRQFYRGVLLP